MSSGPSWGPPRARPHRPSGCGNLNHQRTDAQVGHCPECGQLLNQRLHRGDCLAQQHADARRRQTTFCTSCGLRLIAA